MTDTSGNVGSVVNAEVEKDASAPSGYSVSIDQIEISSLNSNALSFTLSGGEVSANYSYSLGDGTSTLNGSGTLSSATETVSGIDVSGLSDGTLTLSLSLTDTVGNVGSVVNDAVDKDVVAPSGYSVSIDQPDINGANETSLSFEISGGEVSAGYSYSISDGTSTLNGSGTLASATETVSGIDVSGLLDGTLTLSLSLTDAFGNAGSVVNAEVDKDASAPTGYSVSIDQVEISSLNSSALSFTLSGGEISADYSYSIGDGTSTLNGSGTLSSATETISGIDVSGLLDGTLTLNLNLTDTLGNVGSFVNDVVDKDVIAPTGYAASIDQVEINTSNSGALSFTLSGGEVSADYSYNISDGTTAVNGNGTLSSTTETVSGIDVSTLSDGTLTLSVSLSDPFGNTGSNVNAFVDKDANIPTGYSVAIDQVEINTSNSAALSFTINDGEISADYAYSIGDGTSTINGNGTLGSAIETVSGIDVSSLLDGVLTLSLSLTDTSGNTGAIVNAVVDKDASAPSGYSVSIDQAVINITNETTLSFTINSGEITADYTYSIGDGTNAINGNGTLSTANQTVNNVDVSSLDDGTLTLNLSLTDSSDNVGATVSSSVDKDVTAPSGYSVTIDQTSINGANEDEASFVITNGEIGASFNYSLSDGTSIVDGNGTISSGNQSISSIDVSGLNDGTLTLSLTLTDTAGNIGAAVDDDVIKDSNVPSGYTVDINQLNINSSNVGGLSFVIGTGEIGATFAYSITDGTSSLNGTGTINSSSEPVSDIDVSSLSDGNLVLDLILTDASGNSGLSVRDSVFKDVAVPTGYSVSIVQSQINSATANSLEFEISDGEAQGSYTYTISNGDSNIQGSGIMSTASESVEGIDVSSLPDGTLTLSFGLSDSLGNNGVLVSTVVDKDATAPVVVVDDLVTTLTNPDITGTVDDNSATVTVIIGSNTQSPDLTNGTFTIFGGDLSEFPDGFNEIIVQAADDFGNVGRDTAIFFVDATAPELTVDPVITNQPTIDIIGDVDDINASLSLQLNFLTYTPTNNQDGTWSLLADAQVGLPAPGTYEFTVTAVDTLGNTSTLRDSVLFVQTAVTRIPTTFTSFSFIAEWDPVTGAQSYVFELSDNKDFIGTNLRDAVSNTNTFEVTDLYPGKTYFYRVRVNEADSEFSNVTGFALPRFAALDRDSSYLVLLYAQLDGPNWTQPTNWLSSEVRFWQGVTYDEGRIVGLDLNGQGLKGVLPQINGDSMSAATSFNLSNNELTDVSSLNTLSSEATFDVSNNFLDFLDFEGFNQINRYTKIPQKPTLGEVVVLQSEGEDITMTRVMPGTGNAYQWFKDESELDGETSTEFSLSSALFEDEGNYFVEVTNPSFPGDTLQSDPYVIKISSLERDELVLRQIFNALDGDNWTINANWNSNEDLGNWFGVTVEGNRVTEIRLPNNGLSGDAPADINTMTGVRLINLSSNAITSIPDFSNMTNIETVDVSNNILDFGHLEPNVDIANFSYETQGEFGLARFDTIKVGENYTWSIDMGGENNSYSWSFKDVTISDSDSSAYLIEDMDFFKMGDYNVEVTNSLLPGLTLESKNFNLFAYGDISGVVSDTTGTFNGGTISLFRITDKGGYDTIKFNSPFTDSVYLVENVLLDDYVLYVQGDTSEHMPTYYSDPSRNAFFNNAAITYSEGDTIRLRRDTAGFAVKMRPVPRPELKAEDDGAIEGQVELETGEDGTSASRILARRRVRLAGVSLYRPNSELRQFGFFDNWSLFAYTQTDENGNFSFENLPDGQFRILIEYPGIPMDTSSSINFELGEDTPAGKQDENRINLTAVVAEEGISVVVNQETWVYRKYFVEAEVFPIPAEDRLFFKYRELRRDNLQLEIMDVSGRTLLTEPLQKGFDRTYEINLGSLAGGVYMMNIKDKFNGDLVGVYRVIKAK